MAQEKKEAVDRNELLRRLILTKLNTIKKEKFEPKTIDKFSLTFRVFLLRYLNLNYEFTLEELIDELDKSKIHRKLKDKLISIMTLLTEAEYENRAISREHFKSLLNEAVSIVNLATGKVERKVEKEEKIEEVQVKKKVLFNFLHKIGLVKTGEEKKAIKKKNLEGEKERLAKKYQEEIKKPQISESKERLRKKLERHKLLKQIKEWKSEGYDTTLLEAELKGKIKVTGRLSSDTSRLNNKIQEWKSEGYDIRKLEKEIKELKKKK